MKKRSILLQLARDSIQEVFEANRTIDKSSLLKEHPLLNQKINSNVNIYLENKLRGHASSKSNNLSLLEGIILNSKKAAFEDENFTPLTTSEYLHCEIELILDTDEGIISEKDSAILEEEPNLAQVFSE